MPSNKLTKSIIRDKCTKTGRYNDGLGLYLQVSPAGTKSWLFQYTNSVGKVRQHGLGSESTVSLQEARNRAQECRKLVHDGLDPIEELERERLAAKLKAARAVTFAGATEEFLSAFSSTWRNEKHRHQWRSTLNSYAFPIFGDLSVADVDTGLVLKAIEPIWKKVPETAERVRSRIERILDWATVRNYRSGQNPARWRGHLKEVLPSRSRKLVNHHAAMPYAELPAFMAILKQHDGLAARALEVTILTGLRTVETLQATWDEIDLIRRVWTIPRARMKAGVEHKVPLSINVAEILAQIPREEGNPYVFVGGKLGRPLSNMAMLTALKRLHPDLTVHGFRSTFRDWAAEQTDHPNHVVEMALAHTITNKVERAYRRGDLFEKRTTLMDDWANYCAHGNSHNVVLLNERRPRKEAV